MIKNAVILAAGLGSRLKDKTKEKPKGFLELEGISLIERSITALLESNIEKIYIGTGYLSEFYEGLQSRWPEICCIKSDKFRSTSSMYTLYNMRKQLDEDFLLLESDLLYDKIAIQHLIDDLKNDVVLASGPTNSGDEVYIQTDEQHNLVAMSKSRSELSKVYGELVGISKISIERYKLLCSLYKSFGDKKIDYEYMFVESARTKKFFVNKIEDLVWCEIDDDSHLERAIAEVLPRLKLNGIHDEC